ncbi:hypothetical protein GF342_05080 [Candidatus Woesearchaeota archaeon]|nr:hypothetical protein [Candidatus Woesearchaeota archaeon]
MHKIVIFIIVCATLIFADPLDSTLPLHDITCPPAPEDPSICPDGSAPVCPQHIVSTDDVLDVTFTAEVDFDTAQASGTFSADSGTKFVKYTNRPSLEYQTREVLSFQQDCTAQLNPYNPSLHA